MYYSERKEQLIEIIRHEGNISVHKLSKLLFVSEPTIRRDLTVLEKEGKIKRTYGGAVYCELINVEVPLSLREYEQTDAKKNIAKQAEKYIKDGQVIFLDASSTASFLVPHIAKFKNTTVITNSPKTSVELAKHAIRTYCTGGLLLNNSIAYVGNLAEEFIKRYNADIFFFSSRGISVENIITDSSVEETNIRKIMMMQSKNKIFLCTKDKLGKKYMYTLCSTDEIDEVITF